MSDAEQRAQLYHDIRDVMPMADDDSVAYIADKLWEKGWRREPG